jgi:hypothetical protein
VPVLSVTVLVSTLVVEVMVDGNVVHPIVETSLETKSVSVERAYRESRQTRRGASMNMPWRSENRAWISRRWKRHSTKGQVQRILDVRLQTEQCKPSNEQPAWRAARAFAKAMPKRPEFSLLH